MDTPKDPRTDPDPQPGDFDAEIDCDHSDQIEIHEGNPDAKLSIIVSVEGDDAKRLERIATERGQQPGEVVSHFCAAPELLKGSGGHSDGATFGFPLGQSRFVARAGWATWR